MKSRPPRWRMAWGGLASRSIPTVLVLGVLLSSAVFGLARRAERRHDDSELSRQIAVYLSGVQELRSRSEDVLHGLRVLLHLHPELSQSQFSLAVKDLQVRPEGVQALLWAPRVAGAQRATVEATAVVQGGEAFRFTEGDLVHEPEEGPVPAAERDEYLPVMFLEPFQGNERALGYDLLTVPEMRVVATQARDSGSITLSGRVRVRDQDEVVTGFVAAIPVYHPELKPLTEAERRVQFRGCVMAVFVLPDLVEWLQSRTPGPALEVMLLDRSDVPVTVLLDGRLKPGATEPGSASEEELRRFAHAQRDVSIAHRRWQLLFRRGPSWSGAPDWWHAWSLLGGGLLFTGLLALHLQTTHRRAEAVERLVRQRTTELASAHARLQEEMSQRIRTERERLELGLRVQETQKLESLGLLAGGIAHDFNNLLTIVIGNAGLARLEPTRCPAVVECLDQIESAGLKAADLCKQMLAYSGKAQLTVQRLHLGRLVRETVELLRLSITKKATLKLDLEGGIPAVMGDATQLRQVLMNLVINASEAFEGREGTIRITTRTLQASAKFLEASVPPGLLGPGEYVSLEVADDGCGMTPDTLARIFDPFFTTKFTGRGLGLAAVLGIARSHQGALRVESQPGCGTTFWLFLPPNQGPVEETPPATADGADWRGEGCILLVDDEPSVRTTAGRMLQRAGFQVEAAEDGQEGIELFARDPGRFAAVLLDLTMPRMDGEEAFREIRRIWPDARVLLMSGFSPQEAVQRFSGRQLNGFLQKPFGPEELLGALRLVLVRDRLEDGEHRT